MNPDISLGNDVVVFERYSGNSLHTLKRGDIVAIKYAFKSILNHPYIEPSTDKQMP